jgi:hypothetical protein
MERDSEQCIPLHWATLQGEKSHARKKVALLQ